MKLPRNARIFQGQLDVAPFAGVLFLLLMFLLFQSSLVYTPGVRIDLPEVGNPLPGPTENAAVVAIDAKGRIYFESQAVGSLDDLKIKLQKGLAEGKVGPAVVVQADKAVPLETVVQVMNTAHQAGMKSGWLGSRPFDFFAPQKGSDKGLKP